MANRYPRAVAEETLAAARLLKPVMFLQRTPSDFGVTGGCEETSAKIVPKDAATHSASQQAAASHTAARGRARQPPYTTDLITRWISARISPRTGLSHFSGFALRAVVEWVFLARITRSGTRNPRWIRLQADFGSAMLMNRRDAMRAEPSRTEPNTTISAKAFSFSPGLLSGPEAAADASTDQFRYSPDRPNH